MDNNKTYLLNTEMVDAVRRAYISVGAGQDSDRGFLFKEGSENWRILISVLYDKETGENYLVYADADYKGKNYLAPDVDLYVDVCNSLDGYVSLMEAEEEDFLSVRKYLTEVSGRSDFHKPVFVKTDNDPQDPIFRGIFDEKESIKYQMMKESGGFAQESAEYNWKLGFNGTLYVGYIAEGVRKGRYNHARLGEDIPMFLTKITTKILFDNRIEVIGRDSFKGFSDVKEIILPSSLVRIESSAFEGAGISQINLPEGTLGVGSYAFRNCENLTALSIPKSLRVMSDGAFRNCFAIRDVNLTENRDDIQEMLTKAITKDPRF